MTMDMTKFPRGARSAKLCSLEMLKTDGTVPTMNLFKQKRTKGWWPFYAKDENDELTLQVSSLKPYLIVLTMISQGQSWSWADTDDCGGSREKSCRLWKRWPKWSWEANVRKRIKNKISTFVMQAARCFFHVVSKPSKVNPLHYLA